MTVVRNSGTIVAERSPLVDYNLFLHRPALASYDNTPRRYKRLIIIIISTTPPRGGEKVCFARAATVVSSRCHLHGDAVVTVLNVLLIARYSRSKLTVNDYCPRVVSRSQRPSTVLYSNAVNLSTPVGFIRSKALYDTHTHFSYPVRLYFRSECPA